MFSIFKKKEIKLYSPMEGDIISITDVPDQVFSQKMVGDGFAVVPANGNVKSPVDGKISFVFPTNHGFGVTTEEGMEILVHIGIDTVEMKGEGFGRVVEIDDEVKRGQLVVEADLDAIKKHGKSAVTVIVLTQKDKVKSVEVKQGKATEDVAAIAKLI